MHQTPSKGFCIALKTVPRGATHNPRFKADETVAYRARVTQL